MTAYVEKATGVQVDIPDELAEQIGGFEPLRSAPSGEPKPADPEPKPAARRSRRTADDD